MRTWDRSSPWRQGAILTSEAANALALKPERNPGATAVVVISHDCDIAQPLENEPKAEAIVGTFVDTPNGSYTHCKNLRCLHLLCTGGKHSCTVELRQQKRCEIAKASSEGPALIDFEPSTEFKMTNRERRTLQRWLAMRYDRAAFPDEFDRRLKVETKIADRLADAFRDSGNHIPAIFFDLDDGKEVTRNGAEDPYELIITLLYLTEDDADVAQQAAQSAASRVVEIFRSRCCVKDKDGIERWRWIELQDVEVISDQALTYAQSQTLIRWQADHVSLRADPQQPIGPV